MISFHSFIIIDSTHAMLAFPGKSSLNYHPDPEMAKIILLPWSRSLSRSEVFFYEHDLGVTR